MTISQELLLKTAYKSDKIGTGLKLRHLPFLLLMFGIIYQGIVEALNLFFRSKQKQKLTFSIKFFYLTFILVLVLVQFSGPLWNQSLSCLKAQGFFGASHLKYPLLLLLLLLLLLPPGL